MLKIKQYVKAESLEQAYELNQKKTNRRWNALAENEYCADPDCDRSVRTRTGSD